MGDSKNAHGDEVTVTEEVTAAKKETKKVCLSD